MKTFKEFVSLCEESDDKSKALGFQATIRRQNPGGRISPDRRLTDPERRRANPYKPRKDIGTQRTSTDRVQQPTQERGSAAVRERAAAAAKEERRRAAQARAAEKSGGEKPKPKSKDLTKQASELLSNKPAEVDKRPADQPKRAVVGMSREKRKDITRRGSRKLRDLVIQHRAEKQGVDPSKIKLTPDYDIK